jgi:HEPN domain-containing protein
MGLPQAPEARLYYRAAKLRFEEAVVLLKAEKTVGAVYLAGFTVECYLKALILNGVSLPFRKRLLAEFRGRRAHDIEWLKGLYRRHVRAVIPPELIRRLTRVAFWDTDLRYATVFRESGGADGFMKSVVAIANWADGRM